jgi:hypothetical protein
VAADGGDLVRTAEWGRVRQFATGAATREEPAVLAVTGEAGAGKSTLWRAGITAAADGGCRVLRSELSASELDASFGGLSDLLAEVLPGVPLDQVRCPPAAAARPGRAPAPTGLPRHQVKLAHHRGDGVLAHPPACLAQVRG